MEVVVEELATRMAQQGHSVTCYNRGGHHVSGSAFDAEAVSKYKGVTALEGIGWQVATMEPAQWKEINR